MKSPPPSDTRPGALARAARAAGFGTVAAAVALGVGWIAGAVPEGGGAFVLGGVALACAAGALGCLLQARLLGAPAGGDRRLQAQRMQLTLGLDFVLKLLCVLGGVALLWLQDVKFERLAVFAMAFAGAALIFQLAGAVALARSAARGRTAEQGTSDPGTRSGHQGATTD